MKNCDPRAMILFDYKYVKPQPFTRDKFTLKLMGATNLLDSDDVTQSDPYAKFSFKLPDGRWYEERTEVLLNNLNPLWNEEFVFENLDLGNHNQKVI